MAEEPDKLWKDFIDQRRLEVKEELILHYISLVQKIAHKISYQLPSHYSKDDLFSYGIFGLIEAVERYNPALGIPFKNYAAKRIKGSIVDGIRKEDWVPVTTRKKAKLIEQAYQKLENEQGKNISDEAVATELNISVEEFRGWLNNIQYISIISLDEPIAEDENSLIKDIITDQYTQNPAVSIEEQDFEIRYLPVFWIRKDGNMNSFIGKKQFLKIFPEKKKELNAFMKTRNIKFEDPADVRKLAEYCNELYAR